jgi:hypothetical protein
MVVRSQVALPAAANRAEQSQEQPVAQSGRSAAAGQRVFGDTVSLDVDLEQIPVTPETGVLLPESVDDPR